MLAGDAQVPNHVKNEWIFQVSGSDRQEPTVPLEAQQVRFCWFAAVWRAPHRTAASVSGGAGIDEPRPRRQAFLRRQSPDAGRHRGRLRARLLGLPFPAVGWRTPYPKKLVTRQCFIDSAPPKGSPSQSTAARISRRKFSVLPESAEGIT